MQPDFDAVNRALDEWQPEPVSPDFDRRLYRRIEQTRRRAWWWGWRPVFALASAIALAVVLLQTPKPAPVKTVDADRLEQVLNDVDMLQQLDDSL